MKVTEQSNRLPSLRRIDGDFRAALSLATAVGEAEPVSVALRVVESRHGVSVRNLLAGSVARPESPGKDACTSVARAPVSPTVAASVPDFLRWLRDAGGREPLTACLTQDMHDAFEAWCSATSQPGCRCADLVGVLRMICGASLHRKRYTLDSAEVLGPHGFLLFADPGSLAGDCRQWLGQCVRDFRARVQAAHLRQSLKS